MKKNVFYAALLLCLSLIVSTAAYGITFQETTDENTAEHLLATTNYPVVLDDGNIDVQKTIELRNSANDEEVLATTDYPVAYDEYGNVDVDQTLWIRGK